LQEKLRKFYDCRLKAFAIGLDLENRDDESVFRVRELRSV